MKRGLLVITLLTLALMASACTRTPPGGESLVGLAPADGIGGTASPGGADFEGGFDFDGDGLADAGTPTSGSGGTLGSSAGFGGGSDSDGTSSGGGATSGTGGGSGSGGAVGASGGGGGGPVVQGIDGRTIKIVFHHQRANCGDDPQGQNVANEKGESVIAGYVKFFNEEVLKPLNWKLEYEFVDNGGLQCSEKAQAAGLQIVKEIKPFAVLGSSINPDRGAVLADVVTRAGIPHIGVSFQSRAKLAERRGLAWSTFSTAEEALDDLATFIEARVAGTKVVDRSSPVAAEVDRVYGMIAVDTPDGKAMAQFMQQRMAQMGIDLSRVYLVSGDMGVAAQTSSNTVLKMRQDGVNTLIWGFYNGAGSTYTFSEAMNSQNYLPDILTGTFGIAFWDSLHNKRVWENAYGTSSGGALVARNEITPTAGIVPEYDEIAENTSGYIEVWQEYLGNNDSPQDQSRPGAYDTWTQLSLLVTGIMHAGPELDYGTFATGVDSARYGQPNRCTVGRWIGRDYRYEGSPDWNSDGRGGRVGFTTIYWVNEQTPFGTNGRWESFDNYRFFRPGETLPPAPTHDTGEKGVSIPKQQRIGIRPWTPCSQFPNYPTTLD